jgi:hypothetical protein
VIARDLHIPQLELVCGKIVELWCFFRLYSVLELTNRFVPAYFNRESVRGRISFDKQNNVTTFSGFILFFAKCYWLKVQCVRTRAKNNFICVKIPSDTICEKFSGCTNMSYDHFTKFGVIEHIMV